MLKSCSDFCGNEPTVKVEQTTIIVIVIMSVIETSCSLARLGLLQRHLEQDGSRTVRGMCIRLFAPADMLPKGSQESDKVLMADMEEGLHRISAYQVGDPVKFRSESGTYRDFSRTWMCSWKSLGRQMETSQVMTSIGGSLPCECSWGSTL